MLNTKMKDGHKNPIISVKLSSIQKMRFDIIYINVIAIIIILLLLLIFFIC